MKNIERIIEEQGFYASTVVGISMYPMLRNRRDTVIISPVDGRLKKYDIPLYRRGDAYVLHRIVRVLPESYIICGDNCMELEYGITDEQIIGVLTGFYRDDKMADINGFLYGIYVRVWCFLYPIRRLGKRIKLAVRKKGV
ncbi:MAG: hypothetical protein HFG65_00095 [Hungatella sp.]|nr:hypothetical protein [Hungatella sp.]